MIIYVTTASYILALTEQQVQALANSEVRLLVDTTDHAVEILLPPAARFTTMGVKIFVVDYMGNAATNNITVTPNGSDIISGSATISTDNGFVKLEIADSTEWAQTGGSGGSSSSGNNMITFTTVEAQSDYTDTGLSGKSIAIVFYGQGILDPSQYSLAGSTITIDPGLDIEGGLRLVILTN